MRELHGLVFHTVATRVEPGSDYVLPGLGIRAGACQCFLANDEKLSQVDAGLDHDPWMWCIARRVSHLAGRLDGCCCCAVFNLGCHLRVSCQCLGVQRVVLAVVLATQVELLLQILARAPRFDIPIVLLTHRALVVRDTIAFFDL